MSTRRAAQARRGVHPGLSAGVQRPRVVGEQWGAGHEWNNAVLQPARPEFARELGVPLTTFAEWADEQPTPASGPPIVSE
ncbi:hypothetical protein ACFWN1_17055 [Streptomyces sp. NPDC058459]|uniref:hypothetical protein n=1 Tax=Streptomyces sp. NPDC058459 TaxID=3346508 RepID=UPI003656DB0C